MPAVMYSHKHKAWIKECIQCDIVFEVQAKDITEAEERMTEFFYLDRAGGSDGLQARCRSCRCNTRRDRNHGAHRDIMLEEQQGKCGICEIEISFVDRSARVDHCHVTLTNRKILCNRCNIWMAPIDNDEWLAKAIAYRDSFRCE